MKLLVHFAVGINCFIVNDSLACKRHKSVAKILEFNVNGLLILEENVLVTAAKNWYDASV